MCIRNVAMSEFFNTHLKFQSQNKLRHQYDGMFWVAGKNKNIFDILKIIAKQLDNHFCKALVT